MSRRFRLDSVYLFGSYAKGVWIKRSDIRSSSGI
ncbi:MAG: nucleotidyltransferase domain-containing protein [Nitrososphaerota archaeon]|nr:nucleotidyltransferase domain-containing protein [Nitrososphaerota archaeon]